MKTSPGPRLCRSFLVLREAGAGAELTQPERNRNFRSRGIQLRANVGGGAVIPPVVTVDRNHIGDLIQMMIKRLIAGTHRQSRRIFPMRQLIQLRDQLNGVVPNLVEKTPKENAGVIEALTNFFDELSLRAGRKRLRRRHSINERNLRPDDNP